MRLLEIKDRRYDPARQKYTYSVVVEVNALTTKTVAVLADVHDTRTKIFILARNVILYGDQNYTPSQSSLLDFGGSKK